MSCNYRPEVVTVFVFNPRQLERAMQRKGFTAADLAFEMRTNTGGRLKTTESQVYKWLRGDHMPGGEAVLSAARACEVTVESLYESDAPDDGDEGRSLLRDLRELPTDLLPSHLRQRLERFIEPKVLS